jgi:YD repeat-containing protein
VGNIRGFLFAGAVATVAITAISVNAQETINYQYDARGRLVRVEHTGTVNNNVSANYSYDKGDNRTNVNVISPN